jgi:hypothetical protein
MGKSIKYIQRETELGREGGKGRVGREVGKGEFKTNISYLKGNPKHE